MKIGVAIEQSTNSTFCRLITQHTIHFNGNLSARVQGWAIMHLVAGIDGLDVCMNVVKKVIVVDVFPTCSNDVSVVTNNHVSWGCEHQ